MSEKLTEQKIEELIEELLQEKEINLKTKMDVIRKDFGIPELGKKPKAAKYTDKKYYADTIRPPSAAPQIKEKDKKLKQVFKDLAALDGTEESVSDTDIAKAAGLESATDNKEKNIYNLVKFLVTKADPIESDWANAFNPETSKTIQDPATMGDIKPIDMDKQVVEPDSIAFGQMANIGFQRQADPNSPQPMGQFQEGIAASINSFFEGKNSFKSRVDHISNFSKAVFETKDISSLNLSKEKFLAASLFADYITTIVREMDSGTAAYQFEALLAGMAGGNVSGKGDVDSEGNVVAGQMGAVDFRMNDGTFGSSKYYSKVGSGNITQSLTGFQKKAGKSTLYIIAHKKEEQTQKKTMGTADPEKIKVLDVYLVSVMPKRDIVSKGEDLTIKVNGLDSTDAALTSGGKLNLSKNLDNPITLILAGGNGEKLRDALKTVADKDTDNLKEAYKEFQSLFSELYKANQKAQRYASTGDINQGNEALSSVVNADNALINLVAEISGKDNADKDTIKGKKIAGDRKDLQITESKLHSLDQLIAETIRDIKKNKK